MWIQKNLYCQQLIKNTTLSTGSILIDMYYSSFVSVPILIGGSQSHLSGFFFCFVRQNFGKIVGTYKWCSFIL